MHVLFNEPALFQRYLATSPAVVFDGVTMINLEVDAPTAGSSLSARLFTSVGELDDEYAPLVRSFVAALRALAYPGLHLDHVELPDCAHASASPPGFLAGLGAAFPRRSR